MMILKDLSFGHWDGIGILQNIYTCLHIYIYMT